MTGAATRCLRLVAIGLCLVAGAAFAQVDPHAGDDFLQLVDARKYGEAWDASSDYMKKSVSRGEFTTQMVKTRETIGDVASRKLREAKPETDPRGAPPGEYLLVTYDTVFASQGAPKTETLPLIKGADGKWRAVGYFIR
jgi:hypothetical protein